jgi:hypothetical protein
VTFDEKAFRWELNEDACGSTFNDPGNMLKYSREVGGRYSQVCSGYCKVGAFVDAMSVHATIMKQNIEPTLHVLFKVQKGLDDAFKK